MGLEKLDRIEFYAISLSFRVKNLTGKIYLCVPLRKNSAVLCVLFLPQRAAKNAQRLAKKKQRASDNY